MIARNSLTIVSALAAFILIATPASARTYFDDLRDTAPRTYFDDLRDTAPRTYFDDLRDTAPIRAPDKDLAGE